MLQERGRGVRVGERGREGERVLATGREKIEEVITAIFQIFNLDLTKTMSIISMKIKRMRREYFQV